MIPNADEPAYPTQAELGMLYTGLTKREVFAMAAMQGMVVNVRAEESGKEIVRASIALADELLKQLES